jgi:predicted Zn finger-like uncharacterized protein
MPIIVACPTCNGRLRVSDDLVGRKVRCPACNTTFDANAEEAERPPAPEPAVETVPVPAWRNLNLELADKPAPAPAPAPTPAREEGPPLDRTNGASPKGAVEIDLRQADEEDRPRTAPAESDRSGEPPPEREERRPRLNDEHDDLRPCPNCRKMIHREASRCYSCGERFTERRRSRREEDEEDNEFRLRRRPRRDWEPHRGGLVMTLGIISAATLFVCWPLAPIALGCGIAAWWMGGSDMRKIRAGTMDPDGEGTTQAGWICGIVGVCLNALVVLGCGTFIGIMIWADTQQTKQKTRPQFQPPPPVQRKF